MIAYPDILMYIDGKWQQATEHLPIINPADESEIGRLPVASQQHLARIMRKKRRP